MMLSATGIILTAGLFAVGALVALVWSFSAGQWNDVDEGARVVLEDSAVSVSVEGVHDADL